jgi:hypothetical protein
MPMSLAGGQVDQGPGHRRGASGPVRLGGFGQLVHLGHGGERRRIGLGEPERDITQFVGLGRDPADRRLMLGVLLADAVAGDHAEQGRAQRGVHGRRGAPARCRDAVGQPVEKVADCLVAHGHSQSSGSGRGGGSWPREDPPIRPSWTRLT